MMQEEKTNVWFYKLKNLASKKYYFVLPLSNISKIVMPLSTNFFGFFIQTP